MGSNLNKILVGLIIFSVLAGISLIYAIVNRKKKKNKFNYAYLSYAFFLLVGWPLYINKKNVVNKLTSNIKKEIKLKSYYGCNDCTLKLNQNLTYQIVNQHDSIINEGEWDFYGKKKIDMFLIDGQILGRKELKIKD